MLNLLTAYASILTAALVFQFVTGLVELWGNTETIQDIPVVEEPKEEIRITIEEAIQMFQDDLVESITEVPERLVDRVMEILGVDDISEIPSPSLEQLTIRELKELARQNPFIKNWSRWTKTQLIEELSKYQ